MTESSLGPSAYIVLGFLTYRGPATSYDIKRWVDKSVGYFWSFPRSQLYAEPQRLTELGLLTETQEDSGRRKRIYTITQAGQNALRAWVISPTAGFPELRDEGLLRMFFMGSADTTALIALARDQLAQHQARLKEYELIAAEQRQWPLEPSQRTLRMGFLLEQANITFWTEILEQSSGTTSNPAALEGTSNVESRTSKGQSKPR